MSGDNRAGSVDEVERCRDGCLWKTETYESHVLLLTIVGGKSYLCCNCVGTISYSMCSIWYDPYTKQERPNIEVKIPLSVICAFWINTKYHSTSSK